MIREKVAHALTARSLQPCADAERPVDVIGAMGSMSRFSSLLYRLKYGGEITRRNREHAEQLLARKLHPCRKTSPSPMTQRIADLALSEWLIDYCVQCRGRGVIGGRREVTITRRRLCKACKATGLSHRVTRQGDSVIDICTHCAGRRHVETSHVITDEPPHPCHACGGTGRLAVSDADFGRLLQIADDEIHARRKQINYALDVLRRVDVIAATLLNEQLAGL